jgi:hypothetical protein
MVLSGPCFPETFQVQQAEFEFDHPIVAIDRVIDQAVQLIKAETPKETTLNYRVPPTAVTALARSGKTTALMKLFNHLLASDEYCPIFVSFNGNSGFKLRDGETDDQAFLRVVASALLPPGTAPDDMVCPRDVLEKYLQTATKPIVLLADELNQVDLYAETLSKELAALLRELFLDPKGRYLCFTSHWLISLEDAIGRSDSPRSMKFVHVAQTQDFRALRGMLPEGRNLNPVEVPLYGSLPGLVYAVKDGFSPAARFYEVLSHLSVRPSSELLTAFFEQLCNGNSSALMRPFSRFTYKVEDKVVWPLCYVEPFLRWAGQAPLASLIESTHTASKLEQEGHGVEWEFTARAAIGIVASCASFRDLEPQEQLVVGPIPLLCRPAVRIVRLPADITTFVDAHEYLTTLTSRMDQSNPVLVLAWPAYPKFKKFDTITYFRPARGMAETSFSRGQQMKLGKGGIDRDAPEECPGVLLRGNAPLHHTQPTTRQNWVYISKPELKEFLPFSMKHLIPIDWSLH